MNVGQLKFIQYPFEVSAFLLYFANNDYYIAM